MLQKVIAFIELWIGLTFLIALLGFVPVVGSAIASILSTIVEIISQIPYYSGIMAILGSILFIDGLIKLIK